NSEIGRTCRFDKTALQLYLAFALSDKALWQGNFRELSASILRLATLAKDGVIHTPQVKAEIDRLQLQWQPFDSRPPNEPIKPTKTIYTAKVQTLLDSLDTFDKLQLQQVIDVCRQHDSLAAAGRALFDKSRQQRKAVNDSDRLRKYLGKWGLTWAQIIDQ
ncbi:MAG: sigma 54-dependent transcriptional regulator, partial [Moraxella sp.]|nr:sigma 54-dependent transcriptional regulator [Moraxella sp.]